ncbi:MAG: DNA mismatch repair protein MutS, partial [bacterium]|nr:DNA mismatch repair protein MutS [bacterium]
MQQSLTPMLKQYYTVKEEVGDAFLFFRLGDFYEMFGEDAELASRLLEITLTSREAGKERRIPMCGVPYHSAEKYIARLVKKGYSVAICEQVEDPETAKGLVRREVIRIVTPGTLVEDSFLEARGDNYLLAVGLDGSDYGLAYADISTAEFKLTNLRTREELINEIDRLQPAEILLPPALAEEKGSLPLASVPVHDCDDMTVERARDILCRHFGVMSLAGFGCEGMGAAQKAAASVLNYLLRTQKQELPHITSLSAYGQSGRMILDRATVRSLELTFNMRDGGRQGTLLGVLDQTVTTMGGRLMRRWIIEPLVEVPAIERRLEAVQEMMSSRKTSELLHQHLESVYDLERLLSRITLGQANGRDMVAFRSSLAALPDIKALLSAAEAPLLKGLGESITVLEDIRQMIAAAIVDEPPLTLRDGGIIRDGYNEELDRLRSVSREGKGWLNRIETQERERTGIKNLKIGFNQVFGYYIEVTKANVPQVPDDYIRKQTMVNAERYITPELKDYESMILNAEERIGTLEYELFNAVRDA